MVTWKRGDHKPLNKYFNTKEFECHCGVCEDQIIEESLLLRLEGLREEFGAPITITSGYRCPEYQLKLLEGGKYETVKNSTHCKGMAADVTSSLIDRLYSIAPKYFDSIGDGRTRKFLHLDTRIGIRRWRYS